MNEYTPGAGRALFIQRELEQGYCTTREEAETKADADGWQGILDGYVAVHTASDGTMRIIEDYDEAIWLNGGGIGGMSITLDPKRTPRDKLETYHRESVLSSAESGCIFVLDGHDLTPEEAIRVFTDHPLVARVHEIPPQRPLSDFKSEEEMQTWAKALFDPKVKKRVLLTIQYEH